MASTPAGLPDTPNVETGTNRWLSNIFGGVMGLKDGLNDMIAHIYNAWVKLGTGASTPAAETRLEGTGTGTSAYVKGAKVIATKSGTQTITTGGSPTLVTFDQETLDNDTMHNTGSFTSRLTATTPGFYTVTGWVQWSSEATGYRYADIITQSATILAVDTRAAVSGTTTNVPISAQVQLAAGEYVELRVLHTRGSDLTITANTRFSMVRVAA